MLCGYIQQYTLSLNKINVKEESQNQSTRLKIPNSQLLQFLPQKM